MMCAEALGRLARIAGVAAIALFVITSGLASIEPPAAYADAEKKARRLLEKGDKYLQKGDARQAKGKAKRARRYYTRALKSYARAYQLVSKTSIYFAIAKAEAKLERHMDAIRHYQKVIAEVEDDQLKLDAFQAIADLRQYVVAVKFAIKPDGAELSVNGELRGVAPLDEAILLEPGEYTFSVVADDHTPYEETLKFEAGSESVRTIELEKKPVAVDRPDPVPDPDPVDPDPVDDPGPDPVDDPGPDPGPDPVGDVDPEVALDRDQPTRVRVEKPGRVLLYVGGVLTVGMLIGGTTTGFMALSKQSVATDEAQSEENRASARESGKTLALVTDGLAVGTVLLGAYTIYHYLGSYRPQKAAWEEQERKRRKSPDYLLSPYYHGDGGGIAVVGRF